MVRSAEFIEIIQQSLPAEEWNALGPIITEINQQQSRRARKNILTEINNIIIERAQKNNNPSLLLALPDIQNGDIEDLFSRITKQYILTKDVAWLNAFLSLSEKLDKKSNQSRVFAMIARDLIDAGVTEADSRLIDTGMMMLNRISFRKYRSEIMIDIIPLLIVWAITIRDKKILSTSLELIEEIGDISKRSVLHAELAKALATIAVLDRDYTLFIRSIRITTEIRQKIRRQQCLQNIIEKGVKSSFGKEIADIPQFMKNFSDIPDDTYLEVISTLAGQVLERVKDKTQVIAILDELCAKNPSVTTTIVIDLLNKADRSGDPWFLSTAMSLQKSLAEPGDYPVREIVKAGISVARKSNNMHILMDLVPVISPRCSPGILSRIYLQFAQIMLASGDINSALDVFSRTSRESEDFPQYSETLVHLLKESVIKDETRTILQRIFPGLNTSIKNEAVSRAITEIGRDFQFTDIITHTSSLKELAGSHPARDDLILELTNSLIDRGFLDAHDPDILIGFTEFMETQQHKEKAISNIVVRIAKMGVQTKNRDYLQRAVGLTGEIRGQETRSATFSSIIDEASILAAQQADLDLLLRMKVWSNSLLETSLATYAMSNIVEGVIKYAINRQSSEALEEAFKITLDISDTNLKVQMFERIAECFVKIGCTILSNPRYPAPDADLNAALRPFERGLAIIKDNIKPSQVSLKLAGIIDIILSFSRTCDNPDFVIPLAMYAVEIENPYERDAMMSRIIANMNAGIVHPDSTDPYEIMGYLLQKNDGIRTYPALRIIVSRIIERIANPFEKLNGLCNLLDAALQAKDTGRSRLILGEICSGLANLPTEYQKILILSDLAALFSSSDFSIGERCMKEAIRHLETVEKDKDELARRHIVIALVSLNKADPRDEWISTALSIIQKIDNPGDYIQAMISVYRMVRQDKALCNEFLQKMTMAADRISSPYEKASTLMDIVPLAIQDCGDFAMPETLLKKADALTKKINIPSIADTIRDNIAHFYAMLYTKQKDGRFLELAIQIAKTIEDDNIRFQRFIQLGYSDTFDNNQQYVKIKALSEKIARDGVHPSQIPLLERLVRTVADRGKESILFCDLAIFFKREGEEKLSKRMIQNAIKEARIIRPLSRRSFVMCDIALKFYSAGCEDAAQDILDYSIDAATNIRQSSLRDEVFDELGHAIKIMQEM